jgi:hypothetical protein
VALTAEDQQLLKRIYQDTVPLPSEPIAPDDPKYTRIYEEPPFQDQDPVLPLQRGIEFSPGGSLQLFSGFRGTGKSTQLIRLKLQLEAQKDLGLRRYCVLYADAFQYLQPSEPLELNEVLLVLAGAFSDALEKELGPNPARESYWTRFKNRLLNTGAEATELGLKSPGWLAALGVDVDIKLSLKNDPSFRQQLRKYLSEGYGQRLSDVTAFVEEGVKAVREKYGDQVEVVYIFDSLEQMRGTTFNAQEVIQSLDSIFAGSLRELQFPYLHCIYTAPSWLKFTLPGLPVTLLPSIRLWKNTADRTPDQDGIRVMRRILLKRLGEDGIRRLFEDNAKTIEGTAPWKVDRLITLSGGDFRELFRLIRECILRANALPVPESVVEEAISVVRRSYLPLPEAESPWLRKIAETRSDPLTDRSAEAVQRLTRALDTHVLFYFTNGEDWYDVHPLIRDEVLRRSDGTPA